MPEGWPVWRVLLPHIDALASYTFDGTDTVATAALLNKTGLFLLKHGNSRAISYLQNAQTVCQQVLDVEHPDTLVVRNNLALAYQETGDVRRAIALYEQTLRDRERVMGTEHPDILTSRNNLEGYGDRRVRRRRPR